MARAQPIHEQYSEEGYEARQIQARVEFRDKPRRTGRRQRKSPSRRSASTGVDHRTYRKNNMRGRRTVSASQKAQQGITAAELWGARLKMIEGFYAVIIPLVYLYFIQLFFATVVIMTAMFYGAGLDTIIVSIIDFVTGSGITYLTGAMMFAAMITVLLTGIASFITLFPALLRGGKVAFLSGEAQTLKWIFAMTMFPLYFFPLTNFFPWAILYGLLVTLYPR